MPVQHVKGQPAASTYVREKGCVTCDTNRDTSCSIRSTRQIWQIRKEQDIKYKLRDTSDNENQGTINKNFHLKDTKPFIFDVHLEIIRLHPLQTITALFTVPSPNNFLVLSTHHVSFFS